MNRSATALAQERSRAGLARRRFSPSQAFFNAMLIILVIVDLMPFVVDVL